MKQFSSNVLSNEKIGEDFFLLQFVWDSSATIPLPGQFFTIRVSSDSVPLLRRPFAFAGYDPMTHCTSFVYQRRGNATTIMTGMQSGDEIDVIGPLGRPFPIPDSDKAPFLIAGGIGLGPILFLAHTLQDRANRHFVFGSRTKSLVPSFEMFNNERPIICTDDGSMGFYGTVTDYLAASDIPENRQLVLYSCGPMPMLRACHNFSMDHGASCWVSVEQVMACGVGACMGCAVPVNGTQEYARACKEGPVFNSTEIRWNAF